MKPLQKTFLLLFLVLVFGACLNTSTPMDNFIGGEILNLSQDEDNGFLKLQLKTNQDSVITAMMDIKYQERLAPASKQLKEGQQIEIKGVIDCPETFKTIFKKEKGDCFIDIRELKIPK